MVKGADSNWVSFFRNSSYIQWAKKGRGWKYFDTNSYCSSLITYGRQLKATLEYTGMQLTTTEMQKSDNKWISGNNNNDINRERCYAWFRKKEKCNRHVPKPFSKIQLLRKKGEKTEYKMMIKRGKIEKTSETKCKSKGRSYSAPKPVWELLLVRQLQVILGEKLFGPKAK